MRASTSREPAYPTLTFRIPLSLRDRLAAAAEGRPIGEEVRRRLEASFGRVPATEDEKTAQLLAGIAAMAEFFGAVPEPVSTMLGIEGGSVGPWHTDPVAYAAFRAATVMLLRQFAPVAGDQAIEEPLSKPLAAMALNAGLTKAGIGDRLHIGRAEIQVRSGSPS